jgi:hypothetical protein
VGAKTKRFIVVCLGDADPTSLGYDEETLPVLWELAASSKPAARTFNNRGAVMYYISSPRAVAAVEALIAKVEALRASDSRFATLGIGLAEGRMVAEFDWLGRVKSDRSPPLGRTANERAAGQSGFAPLFQASHSRPALLRHGR